MGYYIVKYILCVITELSMKGQLNQKIRWDRKKE